MKKLVLKVIFSCFCIFPVLSGAEKYVDVVNGNDRNSGDRNHPWRRISLSLRRVSPGDTIYILPADKPIAMNIEITNIFGTPDKPVTLDGMNNTFVGVKPLKPEEWQQVSPGLFRKKFISSPEMIWRIFMVYDGKIKRMGRFTKARGAAGFRTPESLGPGEWTIVNKEPTNRKPHEYECFVRLPDDARPQDLVRWSEPYCTTGIRVYGRNSDLCIRNFIMKHFWNDGVGIDEDAQNVVVENIAAIYCGDDGVSAHGSSVITFRNIVCIGNSTGFCHVNKKSIHENFYLSGNLGCDILMTSKTEMILKNIYAFGDSVDGFKISEQRNHVDVSNLIYVKRNPNAGFIVNPMPDVKVKFDNCRISGFSASPTAGITSGEKEVLSEQINTFRKELFSRFGGKLEKALD